MPQFHQQQGQAVGYHVTANERGKLAATAAPLKYCLANQGQGSIHTHLRRIKKDWCFFYVFIHILAKSTAFAFETCFMYLFNFWQCNFFTYLFIYTVDYGAKIGSTNI